MEEKLSTNKNVTLRVKDFLEKISIHYEFNWGPFIIACYVLGILGSPVVIPSLINLLKKFGEINSTRIEKNMQKYDQYRIRITRFYLKAVSNTLIRIGGEAVQPLIELLNSEHPETRKYAAYTLGKIGDRKAYPALKKTLNNPKESELVREVAARAMLQLNPERTEEIIEPDNLTPTEDPLSEGFDQIDLKMDLEVINKHYSSLDDLGPPSEYKLSISLYKYIEKVIDELDYMKKFKKNWKEFILPEPDIQELNLPQKIIEEVDEIDDHSLPCLCGEYLEWAYVKSLSKRMWELSDREWGYHFRTDDVICVYCKNCKRYTGLRRSEDDARREKPSSFYWFYLPRFPKQNQLINEEKRETKRPKWEKRLKQNQY